MAQKIDMFRPYLSGKEVLILTAAMKERVEHEPGNMEYKVLWRKLRQMQFKISEGMMTPAIQRKQTIEESLGAIKNPNEKPVNEFRERLETLAQKHLNRESEGCLSQEEIQEGKRLELLEYGMDLGMFASGN